MAIFLNRNYKTLAVGLGATFISDCWTFFLNEFGVKSQFMTFLGRWIGHFPKGKFIHHTILDTPPVTNEIVIGWMAHYGTGIAFGFLFIRMVGKKWLDDPKITPAFLFGILTLILPLFIFVPSIGFGNPLFHLPDSKLSLMRTLAYHAVFALGLFLTSKLIVRFTSFIKHQNTSENVQ
mgnify:CR=1 FL=1|jgi:uncharacterized protein YneF (UPF0154 family)